MHEQRAHDRAGAAARRRPAARLGGDARALSRQAEPLYDAAGRAPRARGCCGELRRNSCSRRLVRFLKFYVFRLGFLDGVARARAHPDRLREQLRQVREADRAADGRRDDDPGDRRRRLHRLRTSCSTGSRSATSRSSTSTSSPTPATSRTSPRSSGDPRHVSSAATSATARCCRARSSREHRPRAVVHFAAESHVDRSIDGPAEFVQTNVVGTFSLLEAARALLAGARRRTRRTLSASSTSRPTRSTARWAGRPAFTETTPYAPNSPYSACKAGSDHLVRAYHHTYGLPVLITNCSNNYGPLPVPREADPADDPQRARGQAAAGLRRRRATSATGSTSTTTARRSGRCSSAARPGEIYNIGGNGERTNLDVVRDALRACSTSSGRAPPAGYARARSRS